MIPLVTPEEMAAADAATISSGVSAEVLMERAGRAVARAAIGVAGGRYGRRAVILCGPGNNGGDGFVAARVLRANGLSVRCFLVGDPERLRGAAHHHLVAMRRSGLSATPAPADLGIALRDADVIVDAIFGTGFHGAAEGREAAAIRAMEAAPAPVVAVDIPSGVNGTTGAVEGPAARAVVTVALGAQKVGTASAPGSGLAGEVRVADIGIVVPSPRTRLVDGRDAGRILPRRGSDAHKGSNGAVAIVAGSSDMTGAALLACRGADRAGAGYVRLGSLPAVKQALAPVSPEVLARAIGESYEPGSWERFVADVDRSDALVLGPGLGTGPGEEGFVRTAVRRAPVPLVLDADALNNLEGDTGVIASASVPVVITPHPGELGRLLGTSVGEIQADRVGTARRAADHIGCVVLLKGARTVVAEPEGRVAIVGTGSPSLATAGSGDVLAGALGALLAAKMDPFSAAWAAAAVHGLAGEIVAAERGVQGAVAWDVAEALPAAIRRAQETGA